MRFDAPCDERDVGVQQLSGRPARVWTACQPTRLCDAPPHLDRPDPQGTLGKFGGVELSDVAAYAELPDGKVLSGSEAGALLLWDAGAIKALVVRPGGRPCHCGAVEALVHDEATNYALSGGADGVLRLWEVGCIDAEPQPEQGLGKSGAAAGASAPGVAAGMSVLELRPSAEIALPPGTRVRCLLWLDRRTWLVADDAGGLLRVAVPLNLLDAAAYRCSRIFSCHAGRVAGVATLPGCHVVVTAGADGSVRATDYASGAALQQRGFGVAATCMAMLAADGACCQLAVGFQDGSVRRLQRCSDGWLLLGAQRPHSAPVVALAVSRASARAASVAADGTAFFFDMCSDQEWRPVGFCRLQGGIPTCADWAPCGSRLIVGCATGVLLEVAAPASGDVDSTRCTQQAGSFSGASACIAAGFAYDNALSHLLLLC